MYVTYNNFTQLNAAPTAH